MIEQIPRLLQRLGNGSQQCGCLLPIKVIQPTRQQGGNRIQQPALDFGMDFSRSLPQAQCCADHGKPSCLISHLPQLAFNSVQVHRRPPER
ncbi:hypothetical protein [Methylorubrum thiocyanatum]|uniref:hypothetical protein n=1 Tax=Methylorubrum thiocyanatum TaxID=47958 RepID=UPI00364EF527